MNNQPYLREVNKLQLFSMRAVVVGALVGVGLSFLLNLFNMASGLSAFSISEAGAAKIAIGGLIGMVISTIIYSYLMGWVAGYIGSGDSLKPHLGILYGFVSWCLALIITVLFVTHMGQFVTAYSQNLSNSTSTITQSMPKFIETSNSGPMESKSDNNSNQANINVERSAKYVSGALFVTFMLFLLSAVFSCIGGYYGFKPKT